MSNYSKSKEPIKCERSVSSVPRSSIFFLIILCVLAFLAYSNTFRSPFVFDDVDNIVNNPYMKVREISWDSLRPLLLHSLNHKRPLSLFSFALNYRFDRFNVLGYHIVNFIIHLINGVLLFGLIRHALTSYVNRRRFNSENASSPPATSFLHTKSGILCVAFFSTALWLLNPIQIFSVTYIVQRMNSLSAMFSLLCLYCYIKARIGQLPLPSPAAPSLCNSPQTTVERHYWRSFAMRFSHPERLPEQSVQGCAALLPGLWTRIFFAACACVSAVLAVASKQNAILLPIFIILYEACFLADWRRLPMLTKRLRQPKIFVSVLIFIALFSAGVYYIVSYNTGGANPWRHILSLYHGRDFTLKERLLTQPRVLLYYLSIIFYPAPERLALLINVPKSISLTQPISTLYSILALSSIFFGALVFVVRYRLFAFAVFWFFAGHLLESTVIPLELIYLHRNYLPSMFLFLPIVAGLFSLLEPKKSCSNNPSVHSFNNQTGSTFVPNLLSKRLFCVVFGKIRSRALIIYVFLAAILLLFTFWTHQYNNNWRSEVALWKDNLNKYPNLHRVRVNYAVALHHSGAVRAAVDEYLKILKSTPHYSRILYNLGIAYEDVKEYKKALLSYSAALKYNRRFADAWCRQGNLLVEGGRLDDGISCLYAAWKFKPFDPLVNFSLGHALMQKNNAKGALFHLTRAARSDPEYIAPLIDLGLLHTLLGNTQIAKIYFLKVKKLDPDNILVKLYLKE